MSSKANRESILLRINEECAIILELTILHENKEQKWFTKKHKQEMLVLILDAIQQRLKAVYDSRACKKEGEQKKTGDQDLTGIIKGDTVKVGYKFSKRGVNLHCLLPDDSVQSNTTSDYCPYSGGSFKSIALFPEKLNLYVLDYHDCRGQQTTAELARAISTNSQVKTSISDYFSRATGTNGGAGVRTESAVKKWVKLKRIVQNASRPRSTTSPDPSTTAAGGFLSSDHHDNIPTATMATTSSATPNTYQCNSDNEDEEEEEEEGVTMAKEPIYIDSDASSDSAGSHVFSREDVTISTKQLNSKKKVLNQKSSLPKSQIFESEQESESNSHRPNYLGKYGQKQLLCLEDEPDGSKDYPNRSEDCPDGSEDFPDGSEDFPDGSEDFPDGSEGFPDGSEDYQDDGQAGDKDWTRSKEHHSQDRLLNKPPKFPGAEESAIKDVNKTEKSGAIQNFYESFKMPIQSIESRQLHQGRVTKKNPERINKLRSKSKVNKPSAVTVSRKRPLCDSEHGDEESQEDVNLLQYPRSKKPLFDHSIQPKSRVTDVDSKRQRDQEQCKDKDGTMVANLSDSKENTKPASSDIPSSKYMDVVDLCSSEEEEGEGEALLSDNDSLIDVIGDKRDVRRLDNGDIAYLMKRNKQYLKNIFAGKIPCRRHQDYKAGGFLRTDLNHSVRFGPFTDEHQDTIMKALIRVFCRKHSQYFDYVSKVLLPEALAKICMDVHHISHQEAEKFLAETPSASFCV